MRSLSILLSILLAFSFVAIGCEKKAEGPPAAEPMTPPDKAEAPEKAEAPAKPEAPAAPEVKHDPEVTKILDAAIEAHGGLEKLLAARSFKQTANKLNPKKMKEVLGTLVGYWKDGHARGESTRPARDEFVFVRGPEHCWHKSGPVVVPCMGQEKKNIQSLAAVQTASLLWPLKERNWEISAGKTEVGKKECDRLTIKLPDYESECFLDFDPDSHLLVRYGSKGPTGPGFLIDVSGYKDFCDGIKLPTRMKGMTLAGKVTQLWDIPEWSCEPVDEKIFEQPEQVANGTLEEKETRASVVACTKMKGPYDKAGETIEKLMGFVKKQKLETAGAPMMIYLKGPPKVKKAKKYLTEICIPVEAKAPKKPKKKGKFVIKAMKPKKVLAAYGVGPYDKKSPELMKLLTAEAKKRKLKTAGPMCQISFMDPKETAAEELVSEMQIPIKGGKKKKK